MEFLKNSPIIGYAHHRIILNDNDKPIDYEFLEINDTFEKLTGLKAENLIGKTVRQVIPGIEKEAFDWIGYYGDIALNGGEKEFEQYSEPLGKWYRVHVNSIEKLTFTTMFLDITASKKQTDELEAFFSDNLDLLCIADMEGNFVKTNKGWSLMLGYTPEELNTRKFLEFVHPDDIPATLSVMANLGTGDNVLQFTNRYRRKDGAYRFIEWRSHPKGNLIYAAARDVTERIEQEHIIAEKQQQYASLVENSPIVIFRSKNDADWTMLFMSKAVEALSGYPASDFINNAVRTYKSVVLRDDIDFVAKSANHAIAKSESWEIDYRITHKDGGIRWVHEKGRYIHGDVDYLVGFIVDITREKESIEKLYETKEQLELAIAGTNDGIWDWNLKTNELFLSKRWKEMLGYEDGEIKNEFNNFIFLLYEEDIPAVNDFVQRYLNGEIENYAMEFRMKHKDGTLVWILAKGEALRDEKGIPYRMAGSHSNITERKKYEEELRIARKKAEESDRLKSAFLANMSHEIRTPMNGILGFAELLKNPDLSGHDQQNYISLIEKSGARMLNIINNIVDISKIEAGLMELDIKESNINEQIEYIHTFFKPEAETKKIKLFYANPLPAKEATIKTDREKVYAILTNLVKNAIKYTEKGSIEFGYHPKIEGGASVLEFYVKDTGIGIPNERQKAIFERFIQADIADKMAKQGTGLGLSISKAYVEMLGGDIRVESQKGEGSAFYFTLPYNTETEKEIIDLQHVPSDIKDNGRKLKILIAEDDEVSEILVENYIRRHSKEILKARNGINVVNACRNNPDIDLILMDIRLPAMDGYEATRQIRKFNKDVIIIAQTAYGLTGDRKKAIDSGCNDYIVKPINQNELLTLIQKYFGE